MARNVETIERMTDDLDGTTASESISFVFDGVSYVIDLNKKNARALRSDFAKWVEHARKVKAVKRSRTGRRGATGANQTSAIRAWAAAQGLPVNARGRIPSSVIEQYNSAR